MTQNNEEEYTVYIDTYSKGHKEQEQAEMTATQVESKVMARSRQEGGWGTHTARAGHRSRGAAPLTVVDGDTMNFPHCTYLKSTSAQQVVRHGSAPFGNW